MTVYARRRVLSNAILVVAAAAFFALAWQRARPPRQPNESFVAVSPEQARPQLSGCAYREDAVHAAGFIDKLVDGPDQVAMLGWAMFERPLRAVDGVVAVVDGRCAAASVIRQSRPDVAAALGNPAASASGFTLLLDPRQLRRGSHRVVLYAIDARRRARAQLGAPSWVTIR